MWFMCHLKQVTKGRMLAIFILCGLSTAAWFWKQSASFNRSDRSERWPYISEKSLDQPEEKPPAIVLLNAADVHNQRLQHQDVTANFLSKPPPWVPVHVAALDKNFKSLKLVTRNFYGGPATRLDELMKHKVPVISTTNWRLHTPSGRILSIESIQRTLLSGSEGYPVPNVAHYILPFRDPIIQFHHMVSILSCIHVMKPQLLFLWYAPGHMAGGKWWTRLRSNLTALEWEKRVVMATRPLPDHIYTMHVVEPEHMSDIMRMEALLMFGGAYFDIDAIVLKPLRYLRRYPFTIGRELNHGLSNGVILSAPNSTFLAMWHTAYQVFNAYLWSHHSTWLPNEMHKQFPELCHVEETSMNRPNWTPGEVQLIYGIGRQKEWNWRVKNSVLHLWFRMYKKQHDMDSIKKLNSMYGEVCRFILYGSPDLL